MNFSCSATCARPYASGYIYIYTDRRLLPLVRIRQERQNSQSGSLEPCHYSTSTPYVSTVPLYEAISRCGFRLSSLFRLQPVALTDGIYLYSVYIYTRSCCSATRAATKIIVGKREPATLTSKLPLRGCPLIIYKVHRERMNCRYIMATSRGLLLCVAAVCFWFPSCLSFL